MAAFSQLLELNPCLNNHQASSQSRRSIRLPCRGGRSADPVKSENKSCHFPYLETTESQPVFIQRLSDLSFRSWGEKAWMIGTQWKTLNSLWVYNKELRQLSTIRYARVRFLFFLLFFFLEAFPVFSAFLGVFSCSFILVVWQYRFEASTLVHIQHTCACTHTPTRAHKWALYLLIR